MYKKYSRVKYIILKMLRQSICLYFIFRKVSIIKVITCHFSKNASHIIWVPKAQWASASIIKSMAIFSALLKIGVKIKIFSKKDIGSYFDKKIYICVNNKYDIYGFSNHTLILRKIVEQLEKQNNKVYPSSNEIEYWENKAFMYSQFKNKNIPHPRTKIISKLNQKTNFEFPFLIKENHSSGGVGVHKVSNEKEFEILINNSEFYKNNTKFIVQELINMRMDLRVTIVHDRVLLCYWRINTSKDWKKTSTNFGSKINFENIPSFIFDDLISITKSLRLKMAAFDIIFKDDNTNNEFLILEVSPFHSSNPKIDNKEYLNYPGIFKKKISIFKNKSYDFNFIESTFSLHKNLVNGIEKKVPIR